MTLDDAASQRQHAADIADSDVVKSERTNDAILSNIRMTGDIREVIDLLWAIVRRLDAR